jgi:hypothetical protein
LAAMRVEEDSARRHDRTQTTFTTGVADQAVICMCFCPSEGHSQTCQAEVPAGYEYVVRIKPNGLRTRMCPPCATAIQKRAVAERRTPG